MVGGTSLFGGQGGIPNTIIGLFVLGVLNNGLDHVDIDSFLKVLIRGLILLAGAGDQRLRPEAAGEVRRHLSMLPGLGELRARARLSASPAGSGLAIR